MKMENAWKMKLSQSDDWKDEETQEKTKLSK